MDFQLLLNMDKFCMNYAEQSMTYKLCSMSVQSGSLNGGHYYAVCNTNVNNTNDKTNGKYLMIVMYLI